MKLVHTIAVVGCFVLAFTAMIFTVGYKWPGRVARVPCPHSQDVADNAQAIVELSRAYTIHIVKEAMK